jgi:uncharacterized protein (TIGR02687 family)
MSDLEPIRQALHRLFHDEGHRLVFWNDSARDFQPRLAFLEIDGVRLLRLDTIAGLAAKILLERTEPNSRFLIYSPTEEPEPEDDWLYDIRLYSPSFRADRASLLLQELGLLTASLREHLLKYRKFFDARERLQKIKTLVAPNDTAVDLERKLLAVVLRADQPELFHLVRTLFHAWTEGEGDLDLDNPPALWSQIEKFDLDGPFWRMIQQAFGYEEDNPSLRNLFLRLLVTDFAQHLHGELPQGLRTHLLPPAGWSNAVVCLAQWRDSSSKGQSYDRLSAAVAQSLDLDKYLAPGEPEQFLDVMTFLAVEKRIASGLRERVQSTADTLRADEVRGIVARRQAGHWATRAIADSPDAPRQALHAVYDALQAAADFHDLRNRHRGGFEWGSAVELYRAYERELYQFDQLYRHFCEAADLAEEQGWNVIKPLRGDIEDHYVHWYLTNLSLAWGKCLAGPQGLLAKWQVEGVPGQPRFYARHVQPWLSEGENRRAFVIISDAFRYEAAQELATELNGRYRFEATLSSQLGVLPSYTALGMAALLPHRTLAYRGTDVLVDGHSSVAGERDGILQSVGGLACQASDLMAKRKEEGREFVKDRRVVYIYHNTVDSLGDNAATEGQTFAAVRRAIDELAALVAHIINNLNGHHVLVTADHGFLFSGRAPGETDRSTLSDKPASTVLAKKRYLLGTNLPEHEGVWRGRLAQTAGVEGDLEFWIPRGTNLFHFVGGARYAHGGAMPQEIVVPVLTVKHIRGKSAQETKTRPVLVQVLGANHRVTAAQHRFELIQMEPVSERIKPVTLRVAIYDGAEAVTNLQTVKFDSTSGQLDERRRWVSLALQQRDYVKSRAYRLVLQDAETGIEQQSVDVIIDRAFTNDF